MSEAPRGLRVLWATDGSASARSAAPLLQQIVLPATEKLISLTVAPHHLISGARIDPSFIANATRAARAREMTNARHEAEQSLLALDTGRLAVEPAVRWGNPIEEILRATAATKADLVVIGARGHSVLSLLLLGSVAQGVVQHATRPVLVCRPSTRDVKTVVVGYDGSPPAKKAVRFLQRLALPKNARVILTCVVEPFAVPPTMPAAYRARAMKEAHAINLQRHHHADRAVATVAEELGGEGLKVETEVLSGPPGPELNDYAEKVNADLVVVGSRKPSTARHYLLGSTAEKVLRHAKASVLVVR